jgi:2'-5' RNA ligase
MPGELIRTFIALELEDSIKDKIKAIQDTIKSSNAIKGSWVSKDNLHLTLKFLGDTKLKYVEGIKQSIKDCLKDQIPIKCLLNRIGCFPNEKSARVIWAGLDDKDNQIANLAKRLENSLFEFGFKKEKRDFKNHITICRPRQIPNPNQLSLLIEEINKNIKPLEFTISKITFFESQLTPQGSIYTPLSSISLK